MLNRIGANCSYGVMCLVDVVVAVVKAVVSVVLIVIGIGSSCMLTVAAFSYGKLIGLEGEVVAILFTTLLCAAIWWAVIFSLRAIYQPPS